MTSFPVKVFTRFSDKVFLSGTVSLGYPCWGPPPVGDDVTPVKDSNV